MAVTWAMAPVAMRLTDVVSDFESLDGCTRRPEVSVSPNPNPSNPLFDYIGYIK